MRLPNSLIRLAVHRKPATAARAIVARRGRMPQASVLAAMALALNPTAAFAQGGGAGPDYFLGYFIFLMLVILGLAPVCTPYFRTFEVKKDSK